MLFKEFRDQRHSPDMSLGLPDLLNYAVAEDDQTILLKDGSRLIGFEIVGPDLNSAGVEELDAHRDRANRALCRLDEDFAYQIDFVRFPSAEYPQREFADPVSAMIGYENACHYAQEGRHFESKIVLTIACRSRSATHSRIAGFFADDPPQVDDKRERVWFAQQIAEFVDAMHPVVESITRLDMSGLLSHITTCINGRISLCKAPRRGIPLDFCLANQDFHTGTEVMAGNRFVRIVSLANLPAASHAEIMYGLEELPIPFRYSVRGLPQAIRTAVAQIHVLRRNWWNKRKRGRDLARETVGSGELAHFENQHAIDMTQDAHNASAEAESGDVRFCYATLKIVLTADTEAEVNEQVRLVFRVCQNIGFDPRVETWNANEAWLGSIPIHGWYDVRKPFLSTETLADFFPLTGVWPGLATNPCPYYPPNTPALCYGATSGGTPWRFNLHAGGDVGNAWVIGPIGSGKSVGLGTIAANFRAVPNGRIFFFDKGYSAYVLTHALGGLHLDLGVQEVPLQPLARVDDPVDRMVTQGLLEDWIGLQNVTLTPTQSRALYRGLNLMAELPHEQRTITALIDTVQNTTVREGLAPLSLGGSLGVLLDADADIGLNNDFITFELETLMSMGPKATIPVLTHLFHRIEQALDGNPTLIIIDEAWTVLANETFGAKLEEWLRTFRKKNAAVVLATQSLSELASAEHKDVLLESCPTKIYLPNPEARNPQTKAIYGDFGLGERQIEIIANATPKQDYYYVSPLGSRLFQFALGPAALAFIGAGAKGDPARARQMMAEFGHEWPVHWLRERGLTDWADYLQNSIEQRLAA